MNISPWASSHVVSLPAVPPAGCVRPGLRPKLSRPSGAELVNHSGGSMGSAMLKAFFNGFEKKYGIRVVETSPVDFGKLRAMVDSGNVEWDLTEIGGQDAIRAGKANLLDKVDPKIVDRSKYPPTAQNPYVFASSVYTTIIGYRTDVFKNGSQPKSWADWWDAKSSRARLSMRNHPTDNLEFALIADRVPKDKVYPIDFDRSFKSSTRSSRMSRHGGRPPAAGAAPARQGGRAGDRLEWPLLRHHQEGRAGRDRMERGRPEAGQLCHPRGAKNPYWANKMLAELAVPQQQAVYASELGYPGLNLESLNYVDAKVKPYCRRSISTSSSGSVTSGMPRTAPRPLSCGTPGC